MDRTIELILQAQQGDAEAKETLLSENTGLVWSIVRRFSGRGVDIEDLYQIGSIGLLKCIDKFDTSFGVKFSTYAVPMIMGEIKRFLRDDGMIKISRSLKEMAVKAKHMQEELQHSTGRSPTINELAAALDTNVEELSMAMESSFNVESLHAVVHQGESDPIYLIDKLDETGTADENLVDVIALRQIISELSEKEQRIIVMRYFQEKTQTEVAKEIGVSQVQVSRIENKILQSLRRQLVTDI